MGQVVDYVARLVHLATLDQRRVAGFLLDRRLLDSAAVQHIEPGNGDVEAPSDHVVQHGADDRRVLATAFA